MTIAERARKAARSHPFVYDALRADVLNYTAAARFLDVGDEETVAAALRRYGEELEYEPAVGAGRVTMESGLGESDAGEPLLSIGDRSYVPNAGSLTGILATGEVSVSLTRRVLGRCDASDITVEAAGVTETALLIVVDRRDGPAAIQLVEGCFGT